MKKQMKTLVTLGIVAAILLGAYGVLALLLPKEKDPEAGKTYLIKENIGDYAVLTVEYPADFLADKKGGYKYVLGQLPLADGSGTAYEFKDNGVDDGYSYSQSSMNRAFTALTALEYNQLVEENAADTAQYGLSAEKAARLTLIPYTDEGRRVVLLLGNKYELGDYYYVMLEGTTTVYTCKSTDISVFLTGSRAMRDLNLLPSLGENYVNLKSIAVRRPDGDGFSFERISMDEMIGLTDVYSNYRLVEPYAAYGNDTAIVDNFLSPLTQVMTLEAVEDRPADLSKYGLDKPFRVTIVAEREKEPVTLLFDSLNGGLRYMMVEGVDTVYSATSMMSDFSFLNVTPMQLRSGLVWLHAIKNVTDVAISMPSGKHHLWVDDKINMNDSSGTFEAKLNGNAVTQENARALYMSIISIAYDAELAGNVAEATPDYSFVITYRTGRKETLAFYKINNRQYAVRLNNSPMEEVGFTVNVGTLRKVEENIGTILSGGNIK